MKNKGFTLIELLAVIIVLGIISLVAFPPIINQMRKMRDNVSAATLKIIESAAEKHMSNNLDDYPQLEDRKYCISLQELVNGGVLEDPLYDAQTGNKISLEKELSVDIGSSLSKSFELFDIGECGYIDPSGAKEPVLTSNMIPIVRSEDGLRWEKADVKREWYNYDELKWANAVLVTQSSRALYKQAAPGIEILESDILMYYVWIPRFRYKLFNTTFAYQSPRQIEVIFEGKRTTKSNGLINNQWLTHPAFSFGSLQLDGIWVGKFETAYNPATNVTTAQISTPEQNRAVVKPNKYAWTNINASNAFTVVKELNINGNIYGLGSNSDPHLMKNTEWGAVAYLSYSKYGNPNPIWVNPNSSFITGCAGATATTTTSACNQYQTSLGINASTTGNIYGIYDMVGGAYEMVMGAQYLSGNTAVATASSGFGVGVLDTAEMNKYIDKYIYGTTQNNPTAYARSKLGDAMGEVVFSVDRSWGDDYARMPFNTNPWIVRGELRSSGSITGVMGYRNTTGAALTTASFRIVIINQ
jgi:prepilin-type N-terminal cleavage/methylation domain-containing protein